MTIPVSRLVPGEQPLVVHAPLGEVEWFRTPRPVAGSLTTGSQGQDPRPARTHPHRRLLAVAGFPASALEPKGPPVRLPLGTT